MDKQQLQERIKNINDEMASMRQNYAKLEGHLAESLHWLKGIEQKELEDGKVEHQESEQVAQE